MHKLIINAYHMTFFQYGVSVFSPRGYNLVEIIRGKWGIKSYGEIRRKGLFPRDEDKGAYTLQSEVIPPCENGIV